jgi:hypothetical protein
VTTEFTIKGPFEVPTSLNRIRTISRWDRRALWEGEAGEFADSIGCYVFTRKYANKFTPLYIGQTTKGFRDECFGPGKLGILQPELKGHKMLHLFLLVSPIGGVVAARRIKELERFLIETAIVKYPALGNKVWASGHTWSLKGIGTPGRRSDTESSFARMMNLGG